MPLYHATGLPEVLGRRASKSTGTLAASTISLFTIAGGRGCAITSIYGQVTTAISVANSYKLQANPTTGTTADLVAATDIGTTDTPAGSLLGFDGVAASSIQQDPGAVPTLLRPIAVMGERFRVCTGSGSGDPSGAHRTLSAARASFKPSSATLMPLGSDTSFRAGGSRGGTGSSISDAARVNFTRQRRRLIRTKTRLRRVWGPARRRTR